MSKVLFSIKQRVHLTQLANGVSPMNLPYGGFNADFVLYRGTDTTMEFFVKDLDKHPIAVQGKQFKISFIAYDTHELMLTAPVQVEDAHRGLIRITLRKFDTATWPEGFYRYFVSIINEEGTENPLYVDQNRSAVGFIEVRTNNLPRPAPSYTVLPEHFIPSVSLPTMCFESQSYPGPANYSHSNRISTFAIYTSDFTGTVSIQGSLDDVSEQISSNWVDLELQTLSSASGITVVNIEGNYQWLRIGYCRDMANTGTLDQVIIKV